MQKVPSSCTYTWLFLGYIQVRGMCVCQGSLHVLFLHETNLSSQHPHLTFNLITPFEAPATLDIRGFNIWIGKQGKHNFIQAPIEPWKEISKIRCPVKQELAWTFFQEVPWRTSGGTNFLEIICKIVLASVSGGGNSAELPSDVQGICGTLVKVRNHSEKIQE